MSEFSLKHFKEQLLVKKIEGQKIKNEILRKELPVISVEEKQEKQVKSVKLVNDVLVVVLNNGSIITKSDATHDDFDKIVISNNFSDIAIVMASEEAVEEMKQREVEIEKIKSIQKGISALGELDDFVVKENSVYLKGTNRSIPKLLVNEFLAIVGDYNCLAITSLEDELKTDEKYQALKKFFLWCCLNPRAEVAEDLYGFLQKNSFRITKQGFFVALRNVVSLNPENNTKVEFISNSYNKIKAVWKKRPEDYEIWSEDDGSYSMYKAGIKDDGILHFEGNLKSLYLNLPNMIENRFTDAHTRTFDIRVGQVVSMPPEQCSWTRQDCASAGLHFTSDEIHYVGCGDTSVLVIINPMKVVGIGTSKGRCYEYLPIMTVPREEATKILHDLDFDTLELDEEYVQKELEGLAEKAKAGFVAETTKHDFNLPSISMSEINNIILSLEEMNGIIRERVVDIDSDQDDEIDWDELYPDDNDWDN